MPSGFAFQARRAPLTSCINRLIIKRGTAAAGGFCGSWACGLRWTSRRFLAVAENVRIQPRATYGILTNSATVAELVLFLEVHGDS